MTQNPKQELTEKFEEDKTEETAEETAAKLKFDDLLNDVRKSYIDKNCNYSIPKITDEDSAEEKENFKKVAKAFQNEIYNRVSSLVSETPWQLDRYINGYKEFAKDHYEGISLVEKEFFEEHYEGISLMEKDFFNSAEKVYNYAISMNGADGIDILDDFLQAQTDLGAGDFIKHSEAIKNNLMARRSEAFFEEYKDEVKELSPIVGSSARPNEEVAYLFRDMVGDIRDTYAASGLRVPLNSTMILGSVLTNLFDEYIGDQRDISSIRKAELERNETFETLTDLDYDLRQIAKEESPVILTSEMNIGANEVPYVLTVAYYPRLSNIEANLRLNKDKCSEEYLANIDVDKVSIDKDNTENVNFRVDAPPEYANVHVLGEGEFDYRVIEDPKHLPHPELRKMYFGAAEALRTNLENENPSIQNTIDQKLEDRAERELTRAPRPKPSKLMFGMEVVNTVYPKQGYCFFGDVYDRGNSDLEEEVQNTSSPKVSEENVVQSEQKKVELYVVPHLAENTKVSAKFYAPKKKDLNR